MHTSARLASVGFIVDLLPTPPSSFTFSNESHHCDLPQSSLHRSNSSISAASPLEVVRSCSNGSPSALRSNCQIWVHHLDFALSQRDELVRLVKKLSTPILSPPEPYLIPKLRSDDTRVHMKDWAGSSLPPLAFLGSTPRYPLQPGHPPPNFLSRRHLSPHVFVCLNQVGTTVPVHRRSDRYQFDHTGR